MSSTFIQTAQEIANRTLDEPNNAYRVSIVAGGASGGTSSTDEAAYTPASSVGTPVMGAVDDTVPDTVAEDKLAILRATPSRALHVNLRDQFGVEVSPGAGQQYNDGDVRGTAKGTLAMGDDGVNIQSLSCDTSGRLNVNVATALPAGTNAIGKLTANDAVDIGDVTINNAAGASAVNIQDGGNVISVDDGAGSLTVDGTVTANAGTGNFAVAGPAAHDAVISGNPVRVGARALTADYTAVAAGDTADLISTLLGKLVTYPYANPNQAWNYAAASGGITNTTGVTIKAAAGVGVRNYITDLHVINGHATVNTDVQIRDGAAGTVLWRGWAQSAGGGISIHFATPLRGSANTLLEVACGTTGAAVYVNVQGFTAAE